jgi:hypothetical protein
MRKHIMLAACLLALTSVTLVTPADGQSRGETRPPAPVTVVLVDQLPSLQRQYAAIILRRPDQEPRDVILLPARTASASLLDAAVRTLLHARLTQGEQLTELNGKRPHTVTIGVRESQAPAHWVELHRGRVERLFERLRQAAPMEVAGVGTGRSVTFRPPVPQPRSEAR